MSISAKDVMSLRQKTGAGMMDCKKALTETDGDFEAAIKWLREKGIAGASKRSGRVANEGRIGMLVAADKKTGAIIEINSETDFVAMNDEFAGLVKVYSDMALGMAGEAGEDNMIPVNKFNDVPLKELAGKIGENLGIARAAALSGSFVDSYMHLGDQLGVLIQLEGEGATSEAARELAHDLSMQIAAASPLYVTREEVPADVIEKEKQIYMSQMRNEGKPEEMIEKIATGKLNKYFEESCLIDQVYVKEQKQKVKARVDEAVKAAGAPIEVKAFLRFKVGETASEDQGE